MSNPFGDAPFDLRSALTTQRRVMISGRLDTANSTDAAATLMFLDGSSADPVTVVINSPGGPLVDAVGLIDTIALMRAPVTIDVLGRAHGSAGLVVASAPGTRRMGASATISLRLGDEASPDRLTAEELTSVAEATAESHRRLALAIGTRSGQTIDWVLGQFDRGDTFAPADALDLGLIDAIR